MRTFSWRGPATVVVVTGLVGALSAPTLATGADPSVPAPSPGPVTAKYTVTDLGTFGGPLANAHGINDRGEVVGVAETSTTAIKGFLWRDGELIDLGGLSPSGTGTQAYEINDRSEVVGYSLAPDPQFGGLTAMPLYWSAGTGMINLGHDLTRSGLGDARDINNQGRAVGTWRNHPFSWTRSDGYSEMSLLPGAFFDQGEVLATNESGISVGMGANAEAWTRPVRWSASGVAEELPVLAGGRYGRANDINASGLMVGEADKLEAGGRLVKPVLWRPDGTVEEIPLVAMDPPLNMGMAEGVADDGTIIGWDMSAASGDGRQVGWIRQPDGTLTVLNDLIDPASGWDIRVPLDINNHGQIVGIGILVKDGVTYPGRAFLLTPAPITLSADWRWEPAGYLGLLTWDGPDGGQVDIYRDDALVATTDNDGEFTDHLGVRRIGSPVTYQVCLAATTTCSPSVRILVGRPGRTPTSGGPPVTFLGGGR